MEMQKNHLQIDSQENFETKASKFLGVFIDTRLNWKVHLAYKSGKTARGMGILIKARGYFNNDCMKCVYCSFIYRYLVYCNHIWGNTYKTSLSKLQVLQNKAVRVITGSTPPSNTELLYNKSGLINLNDINLYLVGLFMHEIHQGNLPDVFGEYFVNNHHIHNHNTKISSRLHVPKCLHVSFRLGSDIRD